VSLPAGTTQFEVEHVYRDDDPTGTAEDDFTVEVSVTDDDTGQWTGTTTATVSNVAPVATFDSITDSAGNSIGPVPPEDLDVVLQGLEISIEASFSDVGTRDTHLAAIDWGDGGQWSGPVTSPVTARHAYSDLGVKAVGVTVTDDDTGFVSVEREVTVVDAQGAIEDLVSDLRVLVDDPQTPPETVELIEETLGVLVGNGDDQAGNGALDMLGGKPKNSALVKLRKAAVLLAEAGLDRAASQVGLTAKSIMVVAIDEADAKVTTAREARAIAEARALIAAGDGATSSAGAIDLYRQALRAVRPAL
jgi:hypothetical protein